MTRPLICLQELWRKLTPEQRTKYVKYLEIFIERHNFPTGLDDFASNDQREKRRITAHNMAIRVAIEP